MKQQTQRHEIGGLFALLTFAVFALCILLVLLTGAESYRKLTERDADSWERRTCIQYITARVRHADTAGDIFVGNFDGTPAEYGSTLFLQEDVDGETYCTRIYCYEEQLHELFSEVNGEFYPQDGTPVLDAQAMEFRLSDGVLTMEAVDASGGAVTAYLTLRSGEGAAA